MGFQFRKSQRAGIITRHAADAENGVEEELPLENGTDGEGAIAPGDAEVSTRQPPVATGAPLAPLRVAFDARFWEMSGIGTYTREMLTAFARLRVPGQGVVWTIIGPEGIRERLPDGLEVERFVPFDAPAYGAQALLRYPRLSGIDLFHYPHYNLPFVRSPRHVVNVFDLFHLQYGNLLRRKHMSTYLRRLRWSGAQLLTASNVVARELRSQGVAEARISTIALGPGRLLAPTDEFEADREVKPHVVESLAGTPLEPPWFLSVGIDQPHKNMDFLVSALGLYYQRRPNAPPFVWLGLDREGIERRAKVLPAHVRQRIALEPYASAAHGEAIMRGAGALIFPSLAEGFGFPPLEAMARGIPVLCARREPMTTLLGDAPLYFEPSESASLWRMLDRLLDSPKMQHEMQARGLERAKLFNWDSTAMATLELYRKLVHGEDERAISQEIQPQHR